MEEEPLRVKKLDDQEADILPKRSMITPEYVSRARNDEEEKTDQNSSPIEEVRIKKKRIKNEKPPVPLAQDVIAMLEKFKNSSKEERKKLVEGINNVKMKLRDFYNNFRQRKPIKSFLDSWS